jgi:hypothetical protein
MVGLRSAVRILLAVIVGYGVATAITIAASLGLPAEAAPTTSYLAAKVAISFLGAVCAGYACGLLAPDDRRVITLGLLIVLFLSAAIVVWRTSPEARLQPAGYLPLVSLLGVVGIWAGAMIERARYGRSR